MLRFSQLLERELLAEGIRAEVFHPPVLIGGLPARGLQKWLGYIDKFVIFPFLLRRKLADGRATLIHICDHSNALYTRFLSGVPTLVTCHDLLAVRGALGEDTDCPASGFGRVLQQWILRGLRAASFVACDSGATRDDLLRLAGPGMQNKSNVIHLAQNFPYRRIGAALAWQTIGEQGALSKERPFLLHVGSDLRRKNRESILRLAASPSADWKGQIVFAGEPLGESARILARELALDDRVVEIVNPTNEVLQALYNLAFALVYPSRCEGFGWPVIEAHACGCPVICSNQTSLPEIAGAGAALYAPNDIEGMAEAIQSLRSPETRRRWVTAGLDNARRFEPRRMVEAYRQIYEKLATDRMGKKGFVNEMDIAEAGPGSRTR